MFWTGFFGIQSKLYPDLDRHHISYFCDSQKYLITGQIVSFARQEQRKTRYVLDCWKLETQTEQIKTQGRIYITVYGYPDQALRFGDKIQFKSKIKPVRNFKNPGGFDYEKFLRLQGIYGSSWADHKKIMMLPDASEKNIVISAARKIESYRTGFYDFALKQTQGSDTGKILISLVTGKKEVLSNGIRDLFSRAGISHLLAISGLHLSIAAFLFYAFFYWILSFFHGLSISGKAKKAAGILTLLPVLLYAVFTGFSPSTQRAAIMISVVLILFASEKQKDILSSLCVAGICILLTDAGSLFSISFQLSFMAVGFIITGLHVVKKTGVQINTKLVSKLVMMVAVTLFANLGTAPLTAYYFNVVSFAGIVSNLFFIPLIGFIVLPLGLLAMAGYNFTPVISGKLIILCCDLIQMAITVCEKLVQLPFSWAHTVTPSGFELVLIYLFMMALFFLALNKKKAFVFLFAGVLAGAMIQFSILRSADNKNQGLEITILDVGQGNSALIQTRNKENILVDGGGFSGISSFDTGRNIVAPFLWKMRIRRLNYVVLTHPEGDHLNGLVYILENFDVGVLIKNHDQPDTNNYRRLMDICKEKKIKILNPEPGVDSVFLHSARLVFIDTNMVNEYRNFNENSLVFKLVLNRFSMLFAGDIMQKREKRISAMENLSLDSDILLAPHHGSRTSSSKFFLDKTGPGSVIISCGKDNRYGFPHAKVMKRYADNDINVFRTDDDGAVLISSDGNDHVITTSRGGA